MKKIRHHLKHRGPKKLAMVLRFAGFACLYALTRRIDLLFSNEGIMLGHGNLSWLESNYGSVGMILIALSYVVEMVEHYREAERD